MRADVHGSAGLILNSPSPTTRIKCLPDIAGPMPGSLLMRASSSVLMLGVLRQHAAGTGAFNAQVLYQGGDVDTERLHLLHGNPAVADTFEVIDVRASFASQFLLSAATMTH